MADAPTGKNGKNGKSGVTRVHVLALSGESAHVRSLARSWAAGEVSVDDYRTIRTLTLEGMLSGEFASDVPGNASASPAVEASGEASKAALDDDDDEHDITAVSDQTVAEGDDTDPNFEAGVQPHRAPAPSFAPRAALIAGVVLLLLGLIILVTLA